jgi:bifunctional UDP-N-acetylglucosamine pyrophosphorylase / glucosamine-1-phosphate N-acetyltransferase
VKKLSAIVLAAGEGTRLNQGQPSKKPKVLYEVNEKPMICYALEILEAMGIRDIVVVVGYLGEQVEKVVGDKVKYARQEKATGTGEAVRIGLEKIDSEAEHVLVLYGADIYRKNIIEQLVAKHSLSGSVVSFLTAEREDPTGLGRIIRDEEGKVVAIVEEKLATEEQKHIREVNDGAYLFEKNWLNRAIKDLQLTKANEFFLTDLIELAVREELPLLAEKMVGMGWFGVDTPEQVVLTSEFIKKQWEK